MKEKRGGRGRQEDWAYKLKRWSQYQVDEKNAQMRAGMKRNCRIKMQSERERAIGREKMGGKDVDREE